MLLSSASRLAALIQRGEVSSREVVSAHIARIRAVNPILNAVVADRFDAALDEADAADARLRRDGPAGLPPFHGVPFTVKECFALRGMPHTAGLVVRRDVRAEGDAPAVARLRAAGAIPLGVTNTSEACMWMESVNRVYGRTRNPYDARRTAGGSSGGEGAVVGAGGSPFGLGSDIGGSIRMPAFFNGIFGHKPSGGLVPNEGQYPCAQGEASYCLGTGPLARRAEDLWPLLRLLVDDPSRLGDPSTVDWSEITVHDFTGDGLLPLHPELRAAQARCAAHFERLGARVVRDELPVLRPLFDVWSAILQGAGDEPFAQMLGGGAPVRPLRQLGALALGRSPHTLPSIALALLQPLADHTPGRTRRLVERGAKLRAKLTRIVGPKGLVLSPSFTRPAPWHYQQLLRPFGIDFTALHNVTWFAATQIPLGLGSAGLPLGVQVGAIPGNDHLTIAAAQSLEGAFGGWVPPRAKS